MARPKATLRVKVGGFNIRTQKVDCLPMNKEKVTRLIAPFAIFESTWSTK